MNTPITDELQLKLGGSHVVRIEDSRRLERDRAALIKALENWEMLDDEFTDHGVTPVFRSLRIATIAKHKIALAAARANFPKP